MSADLLVHYPFFEIDSMFNLLTRGQKTIVVLIWVVFFGNMLLATCCWTQNGSHPSRKNHTVQVDTNPTRQTNRAEQVKSPDKTIPNSRETRGSFPVNSNQTDGDSDSDETKTLHVEINTASTEEFQQLPGIGPTLSNAIIAWRRERGQFQHIEDIKLVPGIGPKKYEAMKALIFVEQQVPAKTAADGTGHE
ncbi:MAG: helix-hairpin-helix domain-containing protein [Thermoguttaceae bacterium]|nr:helix-hairpin-helix domain-containing protein [Thermoguttaceae bacterium]